MLQIHVGSITEGGWALDEQVDALQLPLLTAVCREGAIHFTRPVHARIHATMAGESVTIDGHVRTAVRLICSRCLEPFEWTLETEFSATAVPDTPPFGHSVTVDEVELTADEMDALTFNGDSIDLRDEVGQQIIMSLPFKPLCRETCKGLCSRCGADLNHTACRCRQEDESNPFSILKKLSLPPKKE